MHASSQFLAGSGRSRNGAGDRVGKGVYANRNDSRPLVADRAAPARARPWQGDRNLRVQRDRPGPGGAAARRPPRQHRYPQRYRHRRHRALARALRALGGRWRDGRRIADGQAARHAALHVHGQAKRHPGAGTDLTRSLYGGLYGFLIVEPASDPGRYDQEVLLAAHHWQGSWVSMQDIRTGPPPDNGLEVLYASASFTDKMLGHGQPVRVREGQRVLFRLLNASPTENVTLALAGHRLTVIALDGNPVPSPQSVDTLFLAPAERADVIVEMNRPGVWILGGIKDEDRKMGLGVVVEYANQRGTPQWLEPPNSAWDYTIFGRDRPLPAPDERLELVFEKVPRGKRYRLATRA